MVSTGKEAFAVGPDPLLPHAAGFLFSGTTISSNLDASWRRAYSGESRVMAQQMGR
jgi:hypothetical protein